jgi:uncharacterized protein DUF5662
MHTRYALYILRHKWLILCMAPRYGVPFWQALIHDWTRFLPSEFLPSAEYFYGRYNTAAKGYRWTRGEYPAYDEARDLHETRNPHHARYWQGKPMPDRYIREMLCDWDAAGQAKGTPIVSWYAQNRCKLANQLNPTTLRTVDLYLAH